VVLLSSQGEELLRRRETFDDLIQRDADLAVAMPFQEASA
jgi:hypothetical protein